MTYESYELSYWTIWTLWTPPNEAAHRLDPLPRLWGGCVRHWPEASIRRVTVNPGEEETSHVDS